MRECLPCRMFVKKRIQFAIDQSFEATSLTSLWYFVAPMKEDFERRAEVWGARAKCTIAVHDSPPDDREAATGVRKMVLATQTVLRSELFRAWTARRIPQVPRFKAS